MTIALYIFAGLFLLLAAGEALVKGAVSIAGRFGIPHAVIGLTVVALGTSMPEMVVSITSVLQGSADLAVGNIIGSNIANLGLILGISGMIYPIAIHGNLVKRELPALVLITLVFTGFCYSGTIGVEQGVILLLLLVTYTAFLIRNAQSNPAEAQHYAQELDQDIPAPTKSFMTALLYTAFGIVFLAVGADTLITGAVMLATEFGISETVIAVTILAIGSSLPELATSAVAACRKHTDIVMGNIIGSNLFNILFAISIPALITPLHVNKDYLQVDIKLMLALTLLFAVVLMIKKSIHRISAGLLLLSFVGYILYLVSKL